MPLDISWLLCWCKTWSDDHQQKPHKGKTQTKKQVPSMTRRRRRRMMEEAQRSKLPAAPVTIILTGCFSMERQLVRPHLMTILWNKEREDMIPRKAPQPPMSQATSTPFVCINGRMERTPDCSSFKPGTFQANPPKKERRSRQHALPLRPSWSESLRRGCNVWFGFIYV